MGGYTQEPVHVLTENSPPTNSGLRSRGKRDVSFECMNLALADMYIPLYCSTIPPSTESGPSMSYQSDVARRANALYWLVELLNPLRNPAVAMTEEDWRIVQRYEREDKPPFHDLTSVQQRFDHIVERLAELVDATPGEIDCSEAYGLILSITQIDQLAEGALQDAARAIVGRGEEYTKLRRQLLGKR